MHKSVKSVKNVTPGTRSISLLWTHSIFAHDVCGDIRSVVKMVSPDDQKVSQI